MKIIKVPIFTEEYKIIVAIGKVEELARYVAKNCDGWDYNRALEMCNRARGNAWNRLASDDPKHPLITLDGELDYKLALCTLPHEAAHAVEYIIDYMNIKDVNGEFLGHGISAVMRYCLDEILKKTKCWKEYTYRCTKCCEAKKINTNHNDNN